MSVVDFFCGCSICQPTKDSILPLAGLFQPLPVPNSYFESYSVEFITDLPLSDQHSCMLKIVNCFTKLDCLILCYIGDTDISAGEITWLLFIRIIIFYGIPLLLVYDLDPCFTGELW